MTLPELPYNGTSGWQGTDTSYDRAVRHDSTGVTETWQRKVLDALEDAGHRGLTRAEMLMYFQVGDPNKFAPSLTVLHKAGLIERLHQKRFGCYVYVGLDYVDGRELKPFTGRR